MDPTPCWGDRKIGMVMFLPVHLDEEWSRLISDSSTVFHFIASTSGPFASLQRFTHVSVVSSATCSPLSDRDIGMAVSKSASYRDLVTVWASRYAEVLGCRRRACSRLHRSACNLLKLSLVLLAFVGADSLFKLAGVHGCFLESFRGVRTLLDKT